MIHLKSPVLGPEFGFCLRSYLTAFGHGPNPSAVGDGVLHVNDLSCVTCQWRITAGGVFYCH